MLLKSIVYRKEAVATVPETATLKEALHVLEESGFRCIPIVDATGTLFRGNIYKMHIYRHKANGGDLDLPVTYLLKNATRYIYTDTSFFKVFFSINELPYLAVLDENNQFYGILTHQTLLKTLAHSWDVNDGSYVITVSSAGDQGELAAISKIVARHCRIASCITLNVQDEYPRRTLLTLPAGVGRDLCETVVKHLQRKGYQVVDIEDLRA